MQNFIRRGKNGWFCLTCICGGWAQDATKLRGRSCRHIFTKPQRIHFFTWICVEDTMKFINLMPANQQLASTAYPHQDQTKEDQLGRL